MNPVPSASDQVRVANTARVLRTLREGGPASRTALAADTGLTKATIGAIVAELVDRGLTVEGVATTGGRGRPSTPISLADGQLLGLGLEVNVDYVAGALVDLGGTVVLTQTRGVPAGTEPLAALVELASTIQDETAGRIVGANLAVPGLVDADRATVSWAPNLRWSDVRPADVLGPALGVPVAVDNDANFAALAESAHGAAARAQSALYVTGTIGIGGGLLEDGRLVRGNGFAGEVGHVPLGDPERDCVCGRRGCWEASIGLRATLTAVGIDETGTPMDTARAIGALAERDARVGEALTQVGRQIGRGLSTLTSVLDPAVVVLGGYFQPLSSWVLPAAREELLSRPASRKHHVPELRVGALGIEAAALGAAEHALSGVLDGSVKP